MADFSVNATELTAPQGAGSSPVAPVEQRAINTMPLNLIEGVASVFAKGLQQNAKEEAAKRESAVMKEYSGKIQKINDALSRGAIKPAEAAARTRAINNEYAAGYPEYIESLKKSADFFKGKTEIGEAEDQLAMERRIREKDIVDASNMGYTFYSGMGEAAKNKTIDAYKTARRLEYEFDQRRKRNEEERAARADGRAEESHLVAMKERKDKQAANQAIVALADSNFDAFAALGQDLMTNASMTFEQKQMILQSNLSRIKAGIQSLAGTNPQMAEGWNRIFDEMATVQQKMLDPKAKAEGQAAELKAQFDALMYQGKLLAVSDPKMYKLVLTDQLFKDPTLVTLENSANVRSWLQNVSFKNEDGTVKMTAPILGTPDEKPTLEAFSKSLTNLQAGKVADTTTATEQAVNVANKLLKDVSIYGGDVPPQALKEITRFYASSQFGKLAKEGKLDNATMQNAAQVFKMQWEPLVKTAIMDRLNSPLPVSVQDNKDGKGKLIDEIDIKFSGDRVSFEGKGKPISVGQQFRQLNRRNEVKKAEDGLNQLIHMGAHLEGHTDYGKYWEANKHLLLPGVFPEPEVKETKAKTQNVSTEPDGLDVRKLTPAQIEWLKKQNPEAFKNGVDSFKKSYNGA